VGSCRVPIVIKLGLPCVGEPTVKLNLTFVDSSRVSTVTKLNLPCVDSYRLCTVRSPVWDNEQGLLATRADPVWVVGTCVDSYRL